MDLSGLLEFANLAVTGICLCAGYIIKHAVPGTAVNRFIPLIMGLLGLTVNMWLHGWGLTPDILLGGLVSGLASTGLHQAFCQLLGIGETKKTETEQEEA